ncbi:MAG: primosomal protein N' (replication factor Y), partial [Saprospiraceae bacterium]
TPTPYTYSVPEEMVADIKFGVRVEVQFGKNKMYSAIVIRVHEEAPTHSVKALMGIMDNEPIITETQLKFWEWMADYYHCTLGEVMEAALPANLKLSSEKRLVLSPLFDGDFSNLNNSEYLIAEALTIQNEITVGDVQKILSRKTVYLVINRLLDKKVLFLYEDLKQKYKPKKVEFVRYAEPFQSQPELRGEAFEKCGKAMKQAETLMAFEQLSRGGNEVRKIDLNKKSGGNGSVIKAMVKKEILAIYEKEVSRVGGYEEEIVEAFDLAEQQVRAIAEIKTTFETKNVTLLHGVTGSGKTRVYIELIKEAMARGEQVLYLLPEIALTTQIIRRLQKIFGSDVAVTHGKIANNQRVDLWKEVLAGRSIVLGARSAIFMPYQNLGLIIIDEEHDTSFKQQDPAPRYHGRDAAILMGHLHGAKVLLGTATPAIETYHNVRTDKYGLVEMPERFGGIQMPEIVLTDVLREIKERKLQSHFTTTLIDELKAALERGEQAILFQNRRGHSPSLRCNSCAWYAECKHCDVTLTYHKWKNHLNCHYCGYSRPVPPACPACGNAEIKLKGFGTEKIEDELKIYLPEAKVARMDFDTIKTRNAMVKIINDFEERRIDILVGTKMVTKGLDFENVGIVGVLSADQLLHFPNFRASEQGFQLITQVAGRAGRKKKRGKVIVQAFDVLHPVLKEVFDNDYNAFFTREIMERHTFNYPPFSRLIKITLKHKKPATLNDGTKLFAHILKQKMGERVLGPSVPHVGRVRGYYLLDILIKLEKNAKVIKRAKEVIREATRALHKETGFSGVRVIVDVDVV